MISLAKKNEILLQLDTLDSHQANVVMRYIQSAISKKAHTSSFKQKALFEIRKALQKGL